VSERWFAPERRWAAPEVRLVAFPFAGGSASVFRGWSAWLPPAVELWPVLLPGRGRRVSEPARDRIATIVSDMAALLPAVVEAPFVLFGHSMGATLAYELTRELAARGSTVPCGLIVSGQAAPHRPDRRPPIHHLPDAAFVGAVRDLGGTPPELFEHPELVELVLPALRADFAAVETYEWVPGPPLDVPLVAFAGENDPVIDPADVAEWDHHSCASSELVTFDGGHFFLLDQPEPVADRTGRAALRLAGAQPR
jgi:surfactin synthase thioesterase subunit